jgi:glycosyltransferase involved in cell wall biosynthesis
MAKSKRKIVLFYKNLEAPGGAERLLVNEYFEFKKLGYDVNIVSFQISDDKLFSNNIDSNDKIILGGLNWVKSILNFVTYIKLNKDAIYLCASGNMEMYISSLLIKYTYSLHIHHPSFMSFTEMDKYSIFQKKHFNKMLQSNFGAIRFKNINNNMSLFKRLYINLRAFISINAIKSSQNNFVLSKYAQNEKKILFDIDSYVFCGALDDDTFNYIPKKDFTKYDKYKYKILTIARLDENKRLDDLLKAFSIYIKEEESNSMLFIGGSGPELENLKNITQNLRIENNVKFLGFIPENELFDWYSMADLFVSIDWADYRITMYESLVMNTKVLLSDETDADEFLLNSKYLYITQPDIENTKNMLTQVLIEDTNISFNELKNYLKKFTWNNYCKKLISVLDKANV